MRDDLRKVILAWIGIFIISSSVEQASSDWANPVSDKDCASADSVFSNWAPKNDHLFHLVQRVVFDACRKCFQNFPFGFSQVYYYLSTQRIVTYVFL